jgi:hypothetical protein
MAAQRRGPRLASFEELQKVTDNFGSRGRLGAGGQGEVWKAVWKEVQVVIKRSDIAATPSMLPPHRCCHRAA